MSIEIEVSERDGVSVVAVTGEVDMTSAPQLHAALTRLIDDGHTRLVLDLEGVEFLDSTGLGVMVGGHKRLLSEGSRLTLVCTQRSIRRVLEITGLIGVFSVHETLETAVAS